MLKKMVSKIAGRKFGRYNFQKKDLNVQEHYILFCIIIVIHIHRWYKVDFKSVQNITNE